MKTGKVYKIIHNQSNICYVGSTFNTLRDRWQCHKKNYNSWLNNNKRSKISIYPYFEEYGIENFKITLIKEYEVIDRRQLEVYETLWIKKLNTINELQAFNIVFKNHDSYKEMIKKYKKKYYEQNKETINKKNKENY